MRLLRTLARSPGFTVVAVVTLALAIGTATAVFSVVDAVVLRGLPYGSASQLRTVYQRSDDGNVRLPSFPTFSDWQAATASVHDAIDGFAFVRGDGVFIGDDPERMRRHRVIAPLVDPKELDDVAQNRRRSHQSHHRAPPAALVEGHHADGGSKAGSEVNFELRNLRRTESRFRRLSDHR